MGPSLGRDLSFHQVRLEPGSVRSEIDSAARFRQRGQEKLPLDLQSGRLQDAECALMQTLHVLPVDRSQGALQHGSFSAIASPKGKGRLCT